MGPDLSAGRCPSCSAAVRPDAPFCGQCYADFRPAPAPAPAPAPVTVAAPTAAYAVPVGDPLTQPLLDFLPGQPAAPAAETPAAAVPAASWPCTRCGAANDLTASVCSVCGSSFLAEVSGDARRLLVLPVVGDLGAMSRGKRAGLALGLVAAVLAPLALITLLLTGSPPPEGSTPPGGTQVTQEAPAP